MNLPKSILITGANGYLGTQALLYFSKQGCQVVAACHNATERKQLEAFLIDKKLSISVLEGDLANETDVRRLVSEAEQIAGGGLDAALNVAGAFEMYSTVEAIKEQVALLFDANFTGNWLLMKHVLPGMAHRGFGRVALVSAAATQSPAGGSMGFYAASKGALNAIVQSTAVEM